MPFGKSSQPRYAAWILFLAVVYIIGLAIHFDLHSLPGGWGDTRFNLYILEHGYRCWLGLDPSFWNAAFYYPTPLITAFSDCHWGTLPIYAFWRKIGMDREHAYCFWIYTLYALNFISAYWGIRRLGASRWAALAGTYLFTFGLPMTSQGCHSQLIPRFWVPIALCNFIFYFRERRMRYLWITAATLLFQLYATLYIGYFLALALAAYWIDRLLPRLRRTSQGLLVYFRKDTHPLSQDLLRIFLVGIPFALCLLPLVLPYFEVAAWMGERPLWEIAALQPRLSSYFQAENGSLVWGHFMHFAKWNGALNVTEQNLFIGLVPLAVLFLMLRRRHRAGLHPLGPELQRRMWGIVILLFLLTLMVGPFTLYTVMTHVPGACAIRSVSRIILVMLFPISLLFAWGLDELFLDRRSSSSWAGLLILALLIVDQSLHDTRSHSYAAHYERLRPYLEALQADDHRHRVVVAVPGAATEDLHTDEALDMMMAAQSAGYATITGYSGNTPKFYPHGMLVLDRTTSTSLHDWISMAPLATPPQDILVLPSNAHLTLAPRSDIGLLPGPGFEFWKMTSVGLGSPFVQGWRGGLYLPVSPELLGKRVRVSFDITAAHRVTLYVEAGGQCHKLLLTPFSSQPMTFEFPLSKVCEKISFLPLPPWRFFCHQDRRFFIVSQPKVELLPAPAP